MLQRKTSQQPRRPYRAPYIVDFGSIEEMTGDCLGVCVDGEGGGMDWG